MDPLTLLSLAQGVYGTAQNLNAAKQDRIRAGDALADANLAKRAGEAAFKDLTESTKYRTSQAPTKAADLTLNLAQQGLDFNRDQAQAGQAQLLSGLRDDPRNVGALLRGLNNINTGVQSAEQRAGQQSITAQKIIDDSIYNQQEAERKRLAGLKERYELQPSMQAYTSQTGLADTLEERANQREAQTIQDGLGIVTTLAGMAKQNEGNNKGGDDKYLSREFNDYDLRSQLNEPIPIVDDREVAGIRDTLDDSTQTPISVGPEQTVEEDLDLRTSSQLLDNLSNYEPDTAPLGVPFTNAVNPNAVPLDSVAPFMEGVPQQNVDQYTPPPTGVQPLDPISYTSVTDPFGLEGRSPAYQGQGGQSVYMPLSPLEGQVFGGMQGYTSLANPFAGYEDGGYIGERGGITTGDFNHDTNKKAIIDEETGEKEGEITGGEGILNDQHLADIVEMIKEDDEDGLLSYLRNLLEEPQFGYEFA